MTSTELEGVVGSAKRERRSASTGANPRFDTLRLVLKSGGPGFCQFALNNACNANCGFCNFARDSLPRSHWKFADRQGAFDAMDIMHRQGIRYLLFTGGEPTLHPDLVDFVRHGAGLGMKMMLVSNAGLFKSHKIRELHDAGISSFIISIDAASAELHEQNRGLPGVCERIREAIAILEDLGVHPTASVTMSRLVDYVALPDFLTSLGFTAVTFSYPLTHLHSNFLGFSGSHLVDYSEEELLAAFDTVEALKKRFRVVNPTASIEDMKRHLRGQKEKFPCLGGYRYFYLDWDLMLWRCHYWEAPMCSIYEFDDSKLVRDNCTRCMIDCYRDASAMQHIAVSVHDAYQAAKRGRLGESTRALTRSGNLGSIGAVLEELPWIIRF